MNKKEQKYDSLLFDMDGTLWDAVDSYIAVWNRTIDELCPEVPHVTRKALLPMMGLPLDHIFGQLVGDASPREVFMARLDANEQAMMPELGGVLYPGTRQTLEELSKTHRLFLVSNCTEHGLPNFLQFTGLTPLFTDAVSFGDTGRDKDYNIALIVRRHGLERPLYIGDTAGDCRSAHAAGVPFAWAAYGFGRGVEDAEYRLDDITELPTIS